MATSSASAEAGAKAVALLNARLARSTLFAEENPHIQTVPTTSNPGAFGMYGLGLTMTLQMLPYTGVVDQAAKGYMYAMALFFGGLGQLVCGCLEYSRKNTFACVTWLCFSAYWLGAGLTGILETAGVFEYSPTGAAAANAMWGFLALMLWTATFGTNLVLNMLLLMLSILLWLEAACQSHPGLYRATGIYGIVVSAVAFYDGTSILYMEMYGREILPVFPFNWSWMRPSQHRVDPMATRKELLALAPEADDATAAAISAAHMAELKV